MASGINVANAQQYKIDTVKWKIDQKTQDKLRFQHIQNDAALWSLEWYGKNNLSEVKLYKLPLNGKLIDMGDVPHPGLREMPSSNPVIATNRAGVAVVSYGYLNQQSKYQYPIYINRNGKWNKIADIIDNDILGIDQIFIDENDNVYFRTGTDHKFYSVANGKWQLMDNPVNDPKVEIRYENVFYINNSSIYSSRITPKARNSNDSDMFQIYKYNSNIINHTDRISLGGGEYTPVCSSVLNNGDIMTAYLNSHDNFTQQSIKLEIEHLDKSTSYPFPTKIADDNSLLGSIISLGKSVVDLTKGETAENSSAQSSNLMTVGEIDINPYLYDPYRHSVDERLFCTTVGKTSYIILKVVADYKDKAPQYVYFKVSDTGK